MLKIKKGDTVKIRCGKERGKVGKVLEVLTAKHRIIIEGINLVKKHIRKRSEAEAGGIREVPASMHISNVGLFCSSCNQAVRFGIKILDDRSKIRVCKKCSHQI